MFDLWAHQWRQRHCQGDGRLSRLVDDIVVGFEKREAAEQCKEALRQRWAKFGLELPSENTRLIAFGCFAQER